MREFRIAQPKTVEELAALLAETKEKALIMAGGTDLIDELKSGVAAPDLVVDIQGVAGLAGISRDKDGLRIGPMTTVAALAGSADVAREFPILVEATSASTRRRRRRGYNGCSTSTKTRGRSGKWNR